MYVWLISFFRATVQKIDGMIKQLSVNEGSDARRVVAAVVGEGQVRVTVGDREQLISNVKASAVAVSPSGQYIAVGCEVGVSINDNYLY
jgi:hypothetical protein